MGKEYVLTEIERSRRPDYSNERWHFDNGDVRRAFQQVFSPEKQYVLFQTIANKDAVDTLNGYAAKRKDMESPWKIRKITEKEAIKINTIDGAGEHVLTFTDRLMGIYQEAIDKIATQKIGQNEYSHYPLVNTIDVKEKDSNSIFWPTVYMVNAEKKDELKKVIDELCDDETFELLKKMEAPQFYRLPRITVLHDLKIQPISCLEKELVISGKDLFNYVDFLVQMTERREYINWHEVD